MNTNQLNILVVVLGLAVIVGVVMVSGPALDQAQPTTQTPTEQAQPTTQTPTEQPADQQATETPTQTSPTLSVEALNTGQLEFNDTTTVVVTATDKTGEPAANVPITISSLGYPGSFHSDQNVTTNASGQAAIEWKFTKPHLEQELKIRSLGRFPPAEHTAFYANATIDGETVEGISTIQLNMTCQTCHSDWRSSPPRETNDSD